MCYGEEIDEREKSDVDGNEILSVYGESGQGFDT